MDTHIRGKYLGEPPYIDYIRIRRQALERRYRLPYIAKLSAVIVLYNIALLLLGPLQQFHSFVNRHYPAPGKLMGRSDGHDPSGCLQQSGNIYPLVCFSCGQDSKTLSLERTGDQRIARVFYSYSRGDSLKQDGQIMEKQ